MGNVSRQRRITDSLPDDDAPEPTYEREITAQPCERPPEERDDVYAALPDLVLECECGEIEPAPADASVGDTFACAYCGEFAVVEEP